MVNLKIDFIDQIVQSCFNLYQTLPKTGKPIEKEWTVLSCVVKFDKNNDKIEVVSLGTGSKCVGATKMSPRGDILNDSHAEVFARRGFLLYLYDNIEKSLTRQPSIFHYENGKFKLNEHIEFIFYSSQLPCGDASIIPKSENDEQFGDILQSNKHKSVDTQIDCKRRKLDTDVHRTGAKCLPDSEQDLKAPGSSYHILGQVRTKPGRGDRTLSVSCSDKIAKWIHLGIQGSLLHMLCGPIHIKYFIFGAGVPYSVETLTRALLNRNECDLVPDIMPHFYQTTLPFLNIKTAENIRPAAGSIVWINLNSQLLEVAVQGKKLGVTKKKATLPSSSLCISKYNIYKRFIEITSKNEELKAIIAEEDISSTPFNKMKRKSVRYQEKWLKIKERFFKTWTVKPDMWDFCMSFHGKAENDLNIEFPLSLYH